MILLLLIESVLRHDISINVKERIYQAAFVVLVVFFAFIIFNDVTKLPPVQSCQAVRQPSAVSRQWSVAGDKF